MNNTHKSLYRGPTSAAALSKMVLSDAAGFVVVTGPLFIVAFITFCLCCYLRKSHIADRLARQRNDNAPRMNGTVPREVMWWVASMQRPREYVLGKFTDLRSLRYTKFLVGICHFYIYFYHSFHNPGKSFFLNIVGVANILLLIFLPISCNAYNNNWVQTRKAYCYLSNFAG